MLTTLKIFVDVVEARSFARAASMNYLTPSAISQRIHQLEAQFRQPLLVRDRKGVVTTDAGRIFYEASREVLDRLERARQEMDAQGGMESGHLRVGAVPSVGLHDLPAHIKVFLKSFPSVKLSLEYMRSREIYRDLLDHVLDLGVVAFPERNGRFAATVFGTDELVLIAAPRHPLARRGPLALPVLDGADFVAFEIGLPTGREVERRLRREGIQVRIVQRFDNIETLKRAVEVGAGVSIVPKSTVEQECRSRTLACVPIAEPGWTRPIAVVSLRGRRLSPQAQHFVDILMNHKARAPIPEASAR